jgi:hypothetical protein
MNLLFMETHIVLLIYSVKYSRNVDTVVQVANCIFKEIFTLLSVLGITYSIMSEKKYIPLHVYLYIPHIVY